ncbi:WhiB family transcriptional regulator [Streptomyces sp. NPDC056160]|uniref:WhiB family transcriptional regulator n=1 Tax=Streptomyces sp. NPDC056160 TaxID=3345731 RepID=UPI0035E36BDE
MTTSAPNETDWQEHAACVREDPEKWFAKNPAAALKICGRCPVRPECLYDAVRRERESAYRPYGVRGGLTGPERRQLPELPSSMDDAVAALRELLPAFRAGDPIPDERTDQPMSDTKADTTAAAASDPGLVTTSKLLRWAEEHPDPDVQSQGARVEAGLAGLQQRYAADRELDAITSEAEKLEQRLAALRARKAELAPVKRKQGRRAHSYKAAAVRAWAEANGIDCPSMGRVPTKVVDAWRAAQGKETADA